MSVENVADKAKQALQKQENGNGGAIQKKTKTVFDMIQEQAPGFKLALPKDFDADRFTRIAITALKSNSKLQECDPYTVLGSLMLSAQLGLEPNSPLHEASLIPYTRSVKVGNEWKKIREAQFQIEYRGLLKLVWNSGLVELVDFDKVCENDEFIYTKGFDAEFKHVPKMKGARGDAYAYYAYAELKGGGKAVVVMSRDDIIEHAKKFSQAYGEEYKNSPWQTDFDSMAIKTVIKLLADKKLPKRTTNESIKFFQAIDRDEKIGKLDSDQIGKAINLEDIKAESAEYTVENEVVDTSTGEITQQEKSQADIFISEIDNLKDTQELNAWFKKNKALMPKLSEDDRSRVSGALTEKEKELLKSN